MTPPVGTEVEIKGERGHVVARRELSVLVRFSDRREEVAYEWTVTGRRESGYGICPAYWEQPMPNSPELARFKTYKVRSTATVNAVRYLGTTPGHNVAALRESGVTIEVNEEGLYMWVDASQAWCRLGLDSYVIEEPNHRGWFYPCTDKDFHEKYEL